jgi:hypothetical protein
LQILTPNTISIIGRYLIFVCGYPTDSSGNKYLEVTSGFYSVNKPQQSI